jgi:hypothetical protein
MLKTRLRLPACSCSLCVFRDVFVYAGGNATGTYKTHNTRKQARLTIL